MTATAFSAFAPLRSRRGSRYSPIASATSFRNSRRSFSRTGACARLRFRFLISYGSRVEVVELVELARAAAVDPVDVLVAVGAHRLVGHADEPRHRLLGPVLDAGTTCASPRGCRVARRCANSGSSERPWICAPRLAAGELDRASARCPGRSRARARRVPAFDLARIAHDERRADAFLVGEAALGTERVLAEEIAVVAEEHDERVVELALPLERVEDRADALRRPTPSCARAGGSPPGRPRGAPPGSPSRDPRSSQREALGPRRLLRATTSAGGSMFGVFGKIASR